MSRFTPAVAVLLDKQIVFHFNGLSHLHLEPYFHAVGFIDEAINWDCVNDDYYDCNIIDCSPCSGGLGFRYFMKAFCPRLESFSTNSVFFIWRLI